MALCAVHGTLHHVWHFAVRWPSKGGPQEVVLTQLQEVAPNAKSHKAEISFAKIHFLIHRKFNAFLCLYQ